jgi:hypothetical protein
MQQKQFKTVFGKRDLQKNDFQKEKSFSVEKKAKNRLLEICSHCKPRFQDGGCTYRKVRPSTCYS